MAVEDPGSSQVFFSPKIPELLFVFYLHRNSPRAPASPYTSYLLHSPVYDAQDYITSICWATDLFRGWNYKTIFGCNLPRKCEFWDEERCFKGEKKSKKGRSGWAGCGLGERILGILSGQERIPNFKRGMYRSFPGGSDSKESAWNAGDPNSIPGMRRFPWRREWLPTPVFLPREFRGQRSLAGYSPGGSKGSDMTANLIPGMRRFPWRREWLPTPVFLPGEFRGQRSLVGYSPRGSKGSDMTERLKLTGALWVNYKFRDGAWICGMWNFGRCGNLWPGGCCPEDWLAQMAVAVNRGAEKVRVSKLKEVSRWERMLLSFSLCGITLTFSSLDVLRSHLTATPPLPSPNAS